MLKFSLYASKFLSHNPSKLALLTQPLKFIPRFTNVFNPEIYRSYGALINKSNQCQKLERYSPRHIFLSIRGTKTRIKGKAKPGKRAGRILKTKQSAAKRFFVTGKGKLKFRHAGKAHLNMNKSRVQLRRLNGKGILEGVFAKNMSKLIM